MQQFATKKINDFDENQFLATIAVGRTIRSFRKKQTVFAQGDPCAAVFYIRKGKVKVKITVVSKLGKDATLGILNAGEFFCEGALTGQPWRMMSATTMRSAPHQDCEGYHP